MKILVLNGSPKGKNSTTLHTALYLSALHPEHSFQVLHAGQKIRSLEKDFTPARKALEEADLLLFCYPVYTFLIPCQLQRFLELMKENKVDVRGKPASQISTSKHFYDVTAHRFLEENGFDLGLHMIRGLSADMDDLLTPGGREEARMFFSQLMLSCRTGDYLTPSPCPPEHPERIYRRSLPDTEKTEQGDIVIVTDCRPEDTSLAAMIEDFRAVLPFPSRVVNIRDFPFTGGWLGCFSCAVSGNCIYKDGFDDFLRRNIPSADAILYAFTIRNHYADAVFKCYDDRQFCNGHRTVTRGLPTGYLLRGDYRYERNLRDLIEARSEVGGCYLCGVATDEEDPAGAVTRLAENLTLALREHLRRPANFYGTGGMKIFRDLIYVMRGLMKADHRFYRQNGLYDFPQKQHGRILQMKAVGGLMAVPSVRKKMQGQMSRYIIAPYEKVVQEAKNSPEK